MPIDTKIDGRPETIEAAAAWVRNSLAAAITDAVSQIYSVRNRADSGWRGAAAEAFRDKMTGAGRTGDDFSESAVKMAQTFDDTAADLRGAQREMERIRTEAASAGLPVNERTIQDPGPAPPAAGAAPTGEAATPVSVAAHDQAAQAVEAHARKVAAYQQAKIDADDVRVKWRASAEAITKVSNTTAAQAWFSVTDIANSTAAAAAAQAHRSVLLKHSTALLNDANQAMRHISAVHDGYTGIVTDRKGMYQNLDRARASTQAAGTAADDAAKATKLGEKFTLKAGGALAAAGVVYEISQGKDPVQATVGGVASFGASVAVGAGVGSLIPVPVVGTAAGAIVGAGVGVFTSGMVDSLFENGVDEIGGAIEDGAKAVADVGSAIGGGVKDAWNSVF